MGIINAMDVANIDFKLKNVYGFNKQNEQFGQHYCTQQTQARTQI